MKTTSFPDIQVLKHSMLLPRKKTRDGLFAIGNSGVNEIYTTLDEKIEFICFHKNVLVKIRNPAGISAWYELLPAMGKKPVKALLMDLDGTTVKSEPFWIYIILSTCRKILQKKEFDFDESDIPHLYGFSVAEHLQYCIKRYFKDISIHYALDIYYDTLSRELKDLSQGISSFKNAFQPNDGLKDFLLAVKAQKIKIGLVTSGFYSKAYPEILSVFNSLGLGRPDDFYDAIITGGYPVKKGFIGTLGELPLKPHPWLYAEICYSGLAIPFSLRDHVIAIEDSGSGCCSARLAGFNVIGLKTGNIMNCGYDVFCSSFANSLIEILPMIL